MNTEHTPISEFDREVQGSMVAVVYVLAADAGTVLLLAVLALRWLKVL